MLSDIPDISTILNHGRMEFGQANHSVCTGVHLVQFSFYLTSQHTKNTKIFTLKRTISHAIPDWDSVHTTTPKVVKSGWSIKAWLCVHLFSIRYKIQQCNNTSFTFLFCSIYMTTSVCFGHWYFLCEPFPTKYVSSKQSPPSPLASLLPQKHVAQ